MYHIVLKMKTDDFSDVIASLGRGLGRHFKANMEQDYSWLTVGPLTYDEHVALIDDTYRHDAIISYNTVVDE